MPLDPYVSRLFQIESGGNPYAVTGSNRGLGQFGPEEERLYGITDANRSDTAAQAAAVQAEAAKERGILTRRLGREPTPGELYLTHQQGIAGGPALLSSDPSAPAWQAIRPFYGSDRIAQQAISGNIPRGSPLHGADPSQITAGDFSRFWVNKFEGGTGQPPGSQYAALNAPPLTPGSPAPALPPPINVGQAPQVASAQPFGPALTGPQPQQQAQQQRPQQALLAALMNPPGAQIDQKAIPQMPQNPAAQMAFAMPPPNTAALQSLLAKAPALRGLLV